MIDEIISEVRRLYGQGKYDEALDVLDLFSAKNELSVELLCLKGKLIQLSESGRYEISVAKKCFLDALKQDPDNINTLLELGWICLNVLDDAVEARRYFTDVTDKVVKLQDEAGEGIKRCVSDISSS